MKKYLILLTLLLISVQIVFSQVVVTKYVGDEFYVGVEIKNAADNGIIGMSTWISYDANIINVVDADDAVSGVQVDKVDLGYLQNGILLASLKKENDGITEIIDTLIIGYSSIPATPTNTDSGMCFKVKFKGLNPGITGITFVPNSSRSLQNAQGNIEAEWYGEAVTLEEEPLPPILPQIYIRILE